MQITTTIEPRYTLDFEADEAKRVIVLSVTRVDDPEQTTAHRLNSINAWALINDFGREIQYQTTPNELAPDDDWDVHKDWETNILHFNIVGSNGRKQHVRLTDGESLTLSRELEKVYNETFLPERWRGGIVD